MHIHSGTHVCHHHCTNSLAFCFSSVSLTVFNIHPLSLLLPLLPFPVFELVFVLFFVQKSHKCLSIAFLPSSVFGSSVFFFQDFEFCDKDLQLVAVFLHFSRHFRIFDWDFLCRAILISEDSQSLVLIVTSHFLWSFERLPFFQLSHHIRMSHACLFIWLPSGRFCNLPNLCSPEPTRLVHNTLVRSPSIILHQSHPFSISMLYSSFVVVAHPVCSQAEPPDVLCMCFCSLFSALRALIPVSLLRIGCSSVPILQRCLDLNMLFSLPFFLSFLVSLSFWMS